MGALSELLPRSLRSGKASADSATAYGFVARGTSAGKPFGGMPKKTFIAFVTFSALIPYKLSIL